MYFIKYTLNNAYTHLLANCNLHNQKTLQICVKRDITLGIVPNDLNATNLYGHLHFETKIYLNTFTHINKVKEKTTKKSNEEKNKLFKKPSIHIDTIHVYRYIQHTLKKNRHAR